MRSGTIALLLGMVCVQQMRLLEDAFFVQFLPLALLIGIFCRSLRLPALFLAGFLWATWRAHLAVAEILPPSLDGAEVLAEGRVVDVPQVDPRRTRFQFEIEGLSPRPGGDARAPPGAFRGTARLSWYGAPELRAGERWRLRLRLRAPRGYVNPGGFDYERWLFARGIRATGYVRGKGEARRLEGVPPFHLHAWRQRAAEAIGARLPERDLAGVVAALAVGVRGGIGRHQWRVFRDTGTAHLMAISGLHVGLVAALVFLLIRFAWSRSYRLCLRLPAQRAAAAAGLAAGAAYSAMAGFSLPTQRALIMLAVVMWCLGQSRTVAFSSALCVALAAVVVLDPFSVLGPSLWLSFAAVAVLAFGMLHRSGAAGGLEGLWWRWGRAQCLAAVGLAPVLLATFGQQPLLSPLANLVAIPWTGGLVVPAAIGGTALSLVWPAGGGLVLEAAVALLELLWPALELLAGTGYLLSAGPVSWLSLVAAAVGVVILCLPREVPGRWLGALWMAPLIGMAPPVPPTGGLWLDLLDVGHGLALVARTRHHALVFDAGPSHPGGFDAGAAVVAPFLRSQGLRFVDAVLISHSDGDHAGGLEGLLESIDAGSIMGAADTDAATACVAGLGWRWDGYDFRLLHPGRTHRFQGNDASCVLRIQGPGGSVLIAADIEAPAEAGLVAAFGDALASDVLIAPHHGSGTSSTARFVRAVRPRHVLFSASDRRRPRLPEPAVVARYRAAGAHTLSTADAGAIRVVLRPGAQPELSGYRRANRRYWNLPGGSSAGLAEPR